MKNFYSPYPGLRPFTREESYLFFGREEQTDQLLKKLGETRFISVVGLSGCGKSSLVRAGMIPALECGYLASAGPFWKTLTMRPGTRPLTELARVLLNASLVEYEQTSYVQDPAQREEMFLPFVQASLSRGPLGLVELLREHPLPERTNLLLLVDQFEEIFRYDREHGRDEIVAFVNLLLGSVKQEEMPIYVVTTMRSEFIGKCA
ncbi:MAG: ATP-binding protein, partial [bacterium]|nr:ATP-binding protein [bacterium]